MTLISDTEEQDIANTVPPFKTQQTLFFHQSTQLPTVFTHLTQIISYNSIFFLKNIGTGCKFFSAIQSFNDVNNGP